MTMHVVIPFIDLAEMTCEAAEYAMKQGEEVEVFLGDNGSSHEERCKVEDWQTKGIKVCMSVGLHTVPGTLDEVWNTALAWMWKFGAQDALVMNNDARIHPQTYYTLRRVMEASGALLVSAVNVGAVPDELPRLRDLVDTPRGGPDYSCFLISKECHEKYPFDPAFTYLGDLDHHRRIMLAGEGHRIFSVPVGYHHLASQTIKRSETAAKRHAEVHPFHQATYQAKWGGPPNEETYWEPFTPNTDPTRNTKTPDLQHVGLYKK